MTDSLKEYKSSVNLILSNNIAYINIKLKSKDTNINDLRQEIEQSKEDKAKNDGARDEERDDFLETTCIIKLHIVDLQTQAGIFA